MAFKSKEDLEHHIRSMVSLMTYVSGGHSLYEFTAPLKLKEVIDELKFIPGFSDISLESLFYKNNDRALNKALEKTQVYNEKYLLQPEKKNKASDAIVQIPTINEHNILMQFKSH